MSPRHFLSILFLTFVALVASACGISDSPVAPQTVDASVMAVTAESYDTLYALKWAKPLGESVSASEVIGPSGGDIKIPELGFKISFPAGAVAKKTLITATAVAGGEVAYTFEPHGITFQSPAKVMQDLRLTTAVGDDAVLSSLRRGYFSEQWSSTLLEGSSSKVKVKEVENAAVDHTPSGNGRFARFEVSHFSGYLLASGRQSRACDSTTGE
jgi:hypothetical protein